MLCFMNGFCHIYSILEFIKFVCFCLKFFVPAYKNRYWYVVIANFREKRFEVICPFKDFNIVKEDALVIVSNFRIVFKCSYLVSRRVDVYRMCIAFASVSNSSNQYVSFDFFIDFCKMSIICSTFKKLTFQTKKSVFIFLQK